MIDEHVNEPNESAQSLVQVAIQALDQALQVQAPSADRQVRQPDSWLLRHCYRHLAQSGSVDAAFAAVELAQTREPLALYQILPLLARRAGDDIGLAYRVAGRLQTLRNHIRLPISQPVEMWAERLLAIAAAAATIDDESLSISVLGRLDQAPHIWNAIVAKDDLRDLLVTAVAGTGLYPLTDQLIRQAIRHHDEPGVRFLRDVAIQAAGRITAGRQAGRSRRLLHRCVETARVATLTSLLSRRHAASIFALEGDVDAVLEQVGIIANVQEARRESGLAFRESESMLLRQVQRPRARPDVDFRLYTLKEAADLMDPAHLSAAQRRNLADWIGYLGAESDGWTAAAAMAALLHLGDHGHAIAVVDRIDYRDPTRSEAFRVLVEGLLAAGEIEEAAHQAQRAIDWARALPERHPERLTIWGVTKAYLAHGQAQRALDILDQRRPPGMLARMRRLLGRTSDEEELREEALRLHADLLLGAGSTDRATQALERIRRMAPHFLDGKALVLFYADHVLEPLLQTRHYKLAWHFLDDMQSALGTILSREQPARVEAVAQLLATHLAAVAGEQAAVAAGSDNGTGPEAARLAAARTAMAGLLANLWHASATRGIWPAVYSIGGSLPLVIALAGSEAVVEIARFAASAGATWRQAEVAPVPAHAGPAPVYDPDRSTA